MPDYPPINAAVRAEILALRESGLSFHRIAAALNRQGTKGHHGGNWYGASVQLVVRGYRAADAASHRCTARCIEQQRACPAMASPEACTPGAVPVINAMSLDDGRAPENEKHRKAGGRRNGIATQLTRNPSVVFREINDAD